MELMSWVWLAVIVGTVILEITTTDVISIWFTFGAIIPFILATATNLHYGWQIAIFFVISAILLGFLRKITIKFLFKNTKEKTNLDMYIGQKYRMLERTDFETIGKIKINDVEWSAIGDKQQTIEKDVIVEIVRIAGNKLLVKEVAVDGHKKVNNSIPKKENA